MSDEPAKYVENENKNKPSTNPWKSGSFYLISFVIIIVVIGFVAYFVSWYALPIALIAIIIIGSIIGTLQFRQDDKLSEKNFVELMGLYFKSLFLLRSKNKQSNEEEKN
jgi:hypothetical protein